MESRCGILCGKCDWQKTEKCKGCTNIDNPFWGVCPVKSCCEEKRCSIVENVNSFRVLN